jgi:hypothetical protein
MAESKQVLVRMSQALKELLEAAAEKSGRSTTGEIVHRLQTSLVQEEAFGGAEYARIVRLMAALFVRGVEFSAAGKPDAANEPVHYMAGLAAVVRGMLRTGPCSSAEAQLLLSQLHAESQALAVVEEQQAAAGRAA